jgi:hypothetical protein
MAHDRHEIGARVRTRRPTLPRLLVGLLSLGLVLPAPTPARGSEPPSIVLAFGMNEYGQLGDGTTTERATLVSIPGMDSISAVAAGYYHSLALRSDGRVLAWGRNEAGELGDGTTTDRHVPTLVPDLTDVVAIDAEYGYSLAIRSNGSVWEWGRRSTLSSPGLPDQLVPAPAGQIVASRISAGAEHRLAVGNGVVQGWGDNSYFELGDGTNTDRWTPAEAPMFAGAIQAEAGYRHSVLLRPNGTVQTIGLNDYGQLGNGTRDWSRWLVDVPLPAGIKQVAAGDQLSLALAADKTMWAWGRGDGGTLCAGDSVFQNRATPQHVLGLSGVTRIAAGNTTTLALNPAGVSICGAFLRQDFTLQWWSGDPELLPGTAGATDMAAGKSHALVLVHGVALDSAAATGLSVQTDSPAAYVSDPVHLSVTVSPVPDRGAVSVGYSPGTSFATAIIDPATGVATFTLTFDTAGTYPLYFEFPGTARFLGSTTEFDQTVVRRPTTTSLTVRSAPPYMAPASINVDVGVSPVPGGGTVDVFDGATSLGTASMNWTTGTGSFMTPALGEGTHQLIAKYLGNVRFEPSESSPTELTVEGDHIPPTTTAPMMTMVAGATSSLTDVPVLLSWTASDDRGVVATQDLEESVDGGPWVSIPVAASTRSITRSLAWTNTYRYRVRATDDSGNVGTFNESSVIDLDLVQESSSSVAYKGPWPQEQSSWALGGRRRYSEKIGSTATFQFTGQAVVWVAVKGDRGRAQVFVDGVDAGIVDLSGSTLTPRWLAFARTWATAGPHTVQIVVIGGTNKSVIDLDAFIVSR